MIHFKAFFVNRIVSANMTKIRSININKRRLPLTGDILIIPRFDIMCIKPCLISIFHEIIFSLLSINHK